MPGSGATARTPLAPEHRTRRATRIGNFYPLGATVQPEGVNFALYSRDAMGVYLLLFDRPEGPPTDVIRIENRTKFVWHTLVIGVKPGQLYGYRVTGDYDPANGKRFNPAKLLIDPYARALTHKASNADNLLLGYDGTSPDRDLSLDHRDNSHVVPKTIVVDDAFDWRGDTSPAIPFERLVIYEVHLKGFTAHPSSRVKSPGTYLGFAQKVPHLKQLGVNAVELLPVHELYVEDFLRSKGLTNYWGYNTLGFFAPESAYGTGRPPGCQVAEFKTMVRELHQSGIEVILDVVYNHTAEGSELGPTLSLRGIDNRTYYCLTGGPSEPGRYYANFTGCGNSLDLTKPAVIRLVMDSLRYWVETMHVDGFRFDLASVLGRDAAGFETTAGFFQAVAQDPVLQRVKLIAEPWDLGTYQVGNFPVDWSEWNGRFRDTVRRFVKGDAGCVKELGARLTGSADLYGDDGRSAFNSVNFATCHDGFTLWDLVSYDRKHNDANLEGNRDGSDDNSSWNSGAEGDTDDPVVNRLRRQLAKNHVCLLLFSSGTPMLLGGDEFLRTQRGNNNAYCQDNDLSWFDWERAAENREMVEFTGKAIALTRRCTVLQRRNFLSGHLDSNNVSDIIWYGQNLDRPTWDDPELRTLCYQLDGSQEPSDLGDYRLFLILNSDPRLQRVKLPALPGTRRWRRVLDSSLEPGNEWCDPGREIAIDPPDHYLANPRSVVVLIGQ
jgi:glycogen operon protein